MIDFLTPPLWLHDLFWLAAFVWINLGLVRLMFGAAGLSSVGKGLWARGKDATGRMFRLKPFLRDD